MVAFGGSAVIRGYCTKLAPARGSRPDLTKSGLILAYILLEDVQKRFGLLRAEVDALEIVDVDVVRRCLVDHAK